MNAFQWVMTAMLVMVLGAPGAGYVYMTQIQAEPYIKACEPPFTTDAAGVPKTTFKAGEMMYTTRNDQFFNKVTGTIQRSFIRDADTNGATLIRTLDLIMPPKLTPDGMCSKATFATLIPKDLPPGLFTYSVTVFMDMNLLRRAVAVPFQPVRIKVD